MAKKFRHYLTHRMTAQVSLCIQITLGDKLSKQFKINHLSACLQRNVQKREGATYSFKTAQTCQHT